MNARNYLRYLSGSLGKGCPQGELQGRIWENVSEGDFKSVRHQFGGTTARRWTCFAEVGDFMGKCSGSR